MTEAVAGSPRVVQRRRVARLLAAVITPKPMLVPRLRGVSHEKAFAFAPALGILLVSEAEGTRASVGAAVFAVTMTLMLGVSAVNHRADVPGHWLPSLRRLDHLTIGLFMAGTWTAFAFVVGSDAVTSGVTAVVWGGAISASVVTIAWVGTPGWIPASIMTLTAWSAAVALPELGAELGPSALALFLLGAFAYTVGAVVYALRRPNPLPVSFGYHEIFHALVVVGAACHYLALLVCVRAG